MVNIGYQVEWSVYASDQEDLSQSRHNLRRYDLTTLRIGKVNSRFLTVNIGYPVEWSVYASDRESSSRPRHDLRRWGLR